VSPPWALLTRGWSGRQWETTACLGISSGQAAPPACSSTTTQRRTPTLALEAPYKEANPSSQPTLTQPDTLLVFPGQVAQLSCMLSPRHATVGDYG
ncbi:hypothetical protein E2I00_003044, partial [Balaenoptera physalus]